MGFTERKKKHLPVFYAPRKCLPLHHCLLNPVTETLGPALYSRICTNQWSLLKADPGGQGN